MKQLGVILGLATLIFVSTLAYAGTIVKRTVEKTEVTQVTAVNSNEKTILVIGSAAMLDHLHFVMESVNDSPHILISTDEISALTNSLKLQHENLLFAKQTRDFDIGYTILYTFSEHINYPAPVNEGKINNRQNSYGQYWRNLNLQRTLKV